MYLFLKSIFRIELTSFGQFLWPSSGVQHCTHSNKYIAGYRWNILIPLASSQHNLYDIYLLLCVQCQTPDDEQRNCPKHVDFYSKNKFEKLLHLVGFIMRMYHNARSSECHTLMLITMRCTDSITEGLCSYTTRIVTNHFFLCLIVHCLSCHLLTVVACSN